MTDMAKSYTLRKLLHPASRQDFYTGSGLSRLSDALSYNVQYLHVLSFPLHG